MAFYNSKDGIDYISYDNAGKKIGEKKDAEIPRLEKAMITQGIQNDGFDYSTIMSRGEEGFVRQTIDDKNKNVYLLECYKNDMKPEWTFSSDPKSDMLETVNLLHCTSKSIVANVAKRKGMMSKKFDTYMLVVDGQTGKKVAEKLMQENKGDLSLISCNVNEDKNEIIISGEYFAPGEDQGNSKSQGLYFMTLDMQGVQKTMKKLSWAKDLVKLKAEDPEDKKEKDPSNALIYWHTIESTTNGHYFAIGEQYKKTISAMGMASMMLSGGRGGAAASSVHVYNMVVMEFDQNFNLIDYNSISKKKTEVLLPPGASYMGSAILGKYVKATGGFDFEFVTRDHAKDAFYVVYKDYNRKDDEGKKADSMIGSIVYEDGKLKTNRSPFNTEGNSIRFSPAKPGYIAISEYFKKKKTIEFHLEKVVY
jgi:hypothetical protein